MCNKVLMIFYSISYFVETLKHFLAGAVYGGDKFETGLSSEVDDLSSKDPEMGPR